MKNEQEVKKVLSRWDVLFLAFGAMIGWGWVIMSGEWIQGAGTGGAMLAFVAGGILVIFVGLTYAELASSMPTTEGALIFVLKGVGPKSAFIASWMLALGYISVVGFLSVSLPTVIEYLFPNYKVGYMYTVNDYDVYSSWVLVGVGGIMIVAIMTPFMFVGFDVIPQTAEEMNVPGKTIGKILILSVILAIGWYVSIILSVGLGLDKESIAASTLPTADVMTNLLGSDIFSIVVILGGIAGIFTTWNAFLIGGSRILYAMAEKKMIPAWFGKLHPKHGTPINGVIFIGALSTISPLLGRPMLVWLTDAGGLAIVIGYLFAAIAFVQLRKNEPNMDRPFQAGKTSIIGWLAIIMSIFFVSLYMPGMPASLIWPYEWVIFGGWAVLGILLMIAMRKNSPKEKMKYDDYKKIV